MKKTALSVFAVTLVLGLMPPQQDAYADTLKEALAKVYNTNPELAAARATLRVTSEQIPQALSGYRPSLNLNSTAGYTSDNSDLNSAQDYTSTSVGLQLNQPLYRGGRTEAAVDRAESTVSAQRAILHQSEQQILLNGIQAYLNVLRDEEIVSLTRNNERVLARQLKAAKDRFEAGEITRTDVSQSEARLSGAVALRVEAEGALTESRATYQRIFGEAPHDLMKPDTENNALDLPINLEEAIDTAMHNNPGLASAMHARNSAEAALREAKGERLPTLSATGSLSHMDIDGDYFAEGETESATAQLRLTIPLYQSGAVSSRIRQASQSVTRSSFERDAIERQVMQDVTSSWQRLSTARSSKTSRQSQVKAARIALDGVKQEEEVGARSVLDTLNAEREYLEARIGLVQAEFAEILAQYTVLATVGQLTAKDLQLPVESYDEDAYANKVRDAWIGTELAE